MLGRSWRKGGIDLCPGEVTRVHQRLKIGTPMHACERMERREEYSLLVCMKSFKILVGSW
jgi:hypothetical protein